MMSALRQADQIVLGHLMVAEKSNEIPAAPELIGSSAACCVDTVAPNPPSFERVIALGLHCDPAQA